MAIDPRATALSRFGLGARPGDLALIGADVRAALRAEIADPNAAVISALQLPDSVAALKNVRDRQQMRRANQPVPKGERNPMLDEYGARIARARQAQIGFAERLAAFWANHFAIETDASGIVRGLAGPYEREAIRPHILGRFEDLLLAATQHPAMLAYLNNATSIGPDSKAGLRRHKGLNENHAREIMELHTIGVDGGYDQADVIALAKVLTGWSFGQSEKQPKIFGRFTFRKQAHEPGPQTVMGVSYSQPGIGQGRAALSALAHSKATAQHIAGKLARHFVADTPPQDLVDTLARTFDDTQGDLHAVSTALIEADAAWAAPPQKLRTPQEFVWATVRALDLKLKPALAQRSLAALGQPLWNPPSPEGFHDDAATWLAPDAMTNRLDFAQLVSQQAQVDDPRLLAADLFGAALSDNTRQAIERAESPQQGTALLLMSPEFQRR
ncbi:MAG TPA: DUF1800 domain-containing protein [Devosiaceae bacterium]